MKVLFGQAYFLRFDAKLWAARQPYAPLGALYAAACARAHGHDVSLFDAMLASSEREWAEATSSAIRQPVVRAKRSGMIRPCSST